jgi:hypothetical protein
MLKAKKKKYPAKPHTHHPFKIFRGKLVLFKNIAIANNFALADLHISLIDANGECIAETNTDAEGNFNFKGYHPSDCTIVSDWSYGKTNRTLFIQLLSAENGHPAASTEITFTEYGERRTAVTDDNGIVRVNNLTDHFYYVHVNGRRLKINTYGYGDLRPDCKPQKVFLGAFNPEIAGDDEGYDTFVVNEYEDYIDDDYLYENRESSPIGNIE